jgi:hypothetical protein
MKDASNLAQRVKHFDKNGEGKSSRAEFVTPSGK